MNNQSEFNYQPSSLKLTNEYYDKYEAISLILDDHPEILDAVHQDLAPALKHAAVRDCRGAKFEFTSDTILRIVIGQIIEGLSLRQIVIRIDDSAFLRQFVRIYNGPMIDFTAYDKLKNRIRPETWKQMNDPLARAAVAEHCIEGQKLRIDTTAVKTNIHWPTDSALLWDTYRVLGRTIERIRELDPVVVGPRRVLLKKVKRLVQKIGRKAARNPQAAEALKPLYLRLFERVENILAWSRDIARDLAVQITAGRYGPLEAARLEFCQQELLHFEALGQRVLDQACRRIILDEAVPNAEKIFSLFEPHTELLKRGKADQPIEFGHMIQIQQVQAKFITDYEVFKKKPVEYEGLEPALERHKELFGEYPEELSADKGYYQNMEQIDRLGQIVELVAIAKKGGRTPAQIERETDPACHRRSESGVTAPA